MAAFATLYSPEQNAINGRVEPRDVAPQMTTLAWNRAARERPVRRQESAWSPVGRLVPHSHASVCICRGRSGTPAAWLGALSLLARRSSKHDSAWGPMWPRHRLWSSYQLLVGRGEKKRTNGSRLEMTSCVQAAQSAQRTTFAQQRPR